jgi:acetylglutamate kinase
MFHEIDKIETLMEAIPYIKKFQGKTVVIKYGGHAMVNDELKHDVARDVAFLQFAGLRPVVVHGGGPEITGMLKKVNKKSEFVSGMRVTDAETVDIAEMVLAGSINTDIVGLINAHGASAIGLNGKDGNLVIADKMLADVNENGEVKKVDIGYVGEVKKINAGLLNSLLDNGYIPVIAPTGSDGKGGTYNINADIVAGEIAAALKAEKLVMLTDVKGIYGDHKDKSTFVSTLNSEQAKKLMDNGGIDGGMIPKVNACMTALDAGAGKTHIIDGRVKHSILTEIFTDSGTGTEVVK